MRFGKSRCQYAATQVTFPFFFCTSHRQMETLKATEEKNTAQISVGEKKKNPKKKPHHIEGFVRTFIFFFLKFGVLLFQDSWKVKHISPPKSAKGSVTFMYSPCLLTGRGNVPALGCA